MNVERFASLPIDAPVWYMNCKSDEPDVVACLVAARKAGCRNRRASIRWLDDGDVVKTRVETDDIGRFLFERFDDARRTLIAKLTDARPPKGWD
jgi:hypothetical protein